MPASRSSGTGGSRCIHTIHLQYAFWGSAEQAEADSSIPQASVGAGLRGARASSSILSKRGAPRTIYPTPLRAPPAIVGGRDAFAKARRRDHRAVYFSGVSSWENRFCGPRSSSSLPAGRQALAQVFPFRESIRCVLQFSALVEQNEYSMFLQNSQCFNFLFLVDFIFGNACIAILRLHPEDRDARIQFT